MSDDETTWTRRVRFVSVNEHWTCSWRLMSLVRHVVVSLSVMDCMYPRDPPQPVRKKKSSSDMQHLVYYHFVEPCFCCFGVVLLVLFLGEL